MDLVEWSQDERDFFRNSGVKSKEPKGILHVLELSLSYSLDMFKILLLSIFLKNLNIDLVDSAVDKLDAQANRASSVKGIPSLYLLLTSIVVQSDDHPPKHSDSLQEVFRA